MKRKKYHKDNFFKHSYCVFDERNFSEIETLTIDYISESGSKYIFLEDGLYRVSNHWGRVANCRWKLNTLDTNSKNKRLGFAKWISFFPNDENDKIFYLLFDSNLRIPIYKHKFEANEMTNYVLRSATETAKVIREIKTITESKNWAKYLNFEDYNALEKDVINALITTNKSLLEIKRNYL